MKKLLTACLLSMGALSLGAQQSQDVITFTASPMIGVDEHIVVNTQYLEEVPGSATIESYQWELRPVDLDGNIGDAIFSETYAGDPSGEFTFPESVTSLLTLENYYQVSLTAVNSNGFGLTAQPSKFIYTDFTLTGPDEICCGEALTVIGNYTGFINIANSTFYQWTVTWCDAAGNSIWPLPYYNSGVLPGIPMGPFSIPNSSLPWPTGLQCDQYYRVDITFTDPYADRRPRTLSKIVHITSFMLSAKTNYCAGQYVYGTGKYCQGNTSPVVNSYQWLIYQSNAAGAILSGNLIAPIVYSGAPNGTSTIVLGSNTLSPGYYLLQLNFLNNNAIQGTRSQVIYINPTPQPVITGAASTCGLDYYSASPTGPGYTYQWGAFNGSTQSPIGGTGSQISAGWGGYNTVTVSVTDQAGCKGTASKSVTNTWKNPNFTISFISYGPTSPYYYIKINRIGNYSMAGVVDNFKIQQITNNSPWSQNTCWTTSAPTWGGNIYLFGYDGAQNFGTITNCGASVPGYPFGRFIKATPLNNISYRIEHSMTVNGVCYQYAGYSFTDVLGIFCTGCRTGEESEFTMVEGESSSFSVFPNPNNGSFTVELSSEADNAEAELFNITGQRVDLFSFSGMTYSYSPSATLAPGLYLLRIKTGDTQQTQRILIE